MENKRVSVLLVEDNKLVSKMSVIVLEQLNCKVDAVATGSSALEYANKSNYDIIFMDIGLPDISGFAVINGIRTNSELNYSVPIIALTAHSDKAYIEQCYRVGATEFLIKPLNNEIGQAVIQRYVS